MNEQKLIIGLKKGDMRAYERAFHSYYPKLVHFADYIVRDFALAKDLVQNVFMKVWRFRERLDSNLSLNNYLYVLTKREILNYLRSKKTFESLDTLTELPGNNRATDANVDISIIREQVDKLPVQRRKVFMMSRFYGLSNKEIAQQLSLAEKTVERHITLADKQLRDDIGVN